MYDPWQAHYQMVLKEMTENRLVPFLGAGVNLCGRPEGVSWKLGHYLPSGGELAAYLSNGFAYPPTESPELTRVAQYVAVMSGSGPLYDELHELLDADYPPTAVHQFLASLPGVLRSKGYPSCYQLIVTSNYDDVLERAFQSIGEPYDLVAYMAEGLSRGKFLHWPPGSDARLIEEPNKYYDIPFDLDRKKVILKRTAILKIHGAVDRTGMDRDSFVISEDDYIDYLTRTDISNLVPVGLASKLRNSHFLFLGYSLRDWNLRVILHRILREQQLSYESWSVQRNPQPVDEEAWRKRNVRILEARLEDYIAALSERLTALPAGSST